LVCTSDPEKHIVYVSSETREAVFDPMVGSFPFDGTEG
jgi:hypothetical protein